jgi:GNAT superfamily N-acetyltransferase
MNEKTADWSLIQGNYLRFMSDCEEENDGTFLIAEIEGKAIGFIFGYIDEKDDSNFELGDADDLYVSEGYVKKEYRKHGIYSALNQLLRRLIQIIISENLPLYFINNHTMQSWLDKQGYRPVSCV